LFIGPSTSQFSDRSKNTTKFGTKSSKQQAHTMICFNFAIILAGLASLSDARKFSV
jgi:hypothetical protein